MKKLEDIPKKNIYQVPDGYFDKLPGIIQSRVAENVPERPILAYSLRFAIPVLLLGVVAFFWLQSRGNDDKMNAEEILASIDTPALIAYLEESELTTDEILETVPLDHEDVTAIEDNVFDIKINEDDLDDLMNEYLFELNN